MPSADDIREAGRQAEAERLVTWAITHGGNANLALLARLVVALETLGDVMRDQPPR